jgi:predicted nucleic acid-binding protein
MPLRAADARAGRWDAAIAMSRGAELATRNVADFAGRELEVINPWL